MKYLVLLCDGMADYPNPELEGKTPMEAANKPLMDTLFSKSEAGLVQTVPEGFPPGSDVANLSVMGYAPEKYYSGRAPLEAVSLGIDLGKEEAALRCNLVTLSSEADFGEKVMLDYCAGDISTEDASVLIRFLSEKLAGSLRLYPGFCYRHCLISPLEGIMETKLTPPHDISGKRVGEYLPQGAKGEQLTAFMKKASLLLEAHPLNQKRIDEGKKPANAIWLWGQGTKPALENFQKLRGLRGCVISAVDLLKGIAVCAGMVSPEVEGATGYIDTNFAGKAKEALSRFRTDSDFVYLHLEAPDECGHRGEAANKVKSLELIDELVLKPLIAGLNEFPEGYRVMVLPDHATPLSLKTHTSDPVPYLIYDSQSPKAFSSGKFSEATAKAAGNFFTSGPALLEYFLRGTRAGTSRRGAPAGISR